VSADTWAVVDGRTLTRDAVEKAFRRTRDDAQTLSNEEALAVKLSLLNEMIVQDLLVAKARELKIELSDTELNTAYDEAKKNITPDAFQKELANRNITAEDMREGLRRDLTAQKVLEREVRSKVAPTDQEVSEFFNANRERFNIPEESYALAQIVVTPVRDQQITNRSGDDATTAEAATAKAAMLMERLKGGASFRDLAADFSEDPDSAPRGGDLGLVGVSRLAKAPQPMRDAVLKKTPGTASMISIGGAHTIVLVVAHEPAGQRDLSTPAVRDGITGTLRERKEQLLRAAYLTSLQSDANVVNHLARRIVDAQAKSPELRLLSPPAK
jgi:peptidyl-prolyl cis-trans isomerase SurA